jgi:phosphate transport system protein
MAILRKIQTISGTYFLSLPKTWIQQQRLAKGDVLTILPRSDGRLIIETPSKNAQPTTRTTIAPSPMMERILTANYLLGYDVIEVTDDSRLPAEIYTRIRRSIQRLVGMEIVEENASRIVIHCLLESAALPPERIVRRQHLLAHSMLRDVLTALQERDATLAHAIVDRDNEVDRLYFLLVRLLRTIIRQPSLSDTLAFSPIECLDFRLMASYIEAIADYAQTIARTIIEFQETPLPLTIVHPLHDLGDTALTMHQRAFHAILARDLNTVEQVLELEHQSKQRIRHFDESLSGESIEVITYSTAIASALTKICDLSVDLADLVV